MTAAAFDDRNLLTAAGLIPVLGLAQHCGLAHLADEHLSVPIDKGAHAGRKLTALVAGALTTLGHTGPRMPPGSVLSETTHRPVDLPRRGRRGINKAPSGSLPGGARFQSHRPIPASSREKHAMSAEIVRVIAGVGDRDG